MISGTLSSAHRLRLEQILPKFLVDSLFDINNDNNISNNDKANKVNNSDEMERLQEERIDNLISFLYDERIAKFQSRIFSERTNVMNNNGNYNSGGGNEKNNWEELEDFIFNQEFVEPFKGKKTRKGKSNVDSNQISMNDENSSEYVPLYLPKFNTFYKHKNENLHIEKDDEGFECFSSEDTELPLRVENSEHIDPLRRERNIARSKAMISSFHLRIQEDVKPFVQNLLQGPLRPFLNEKSLSDNLKEATFGYIQTEEQANDFYRQLCGEDEQITLTIDMVLYEIRRLLSLKEKKKKVKKEFHPLFSQTFKEQYLKYLRAVDYVIVQQEIDNLDQFSEIPSRIRHATYPKIVTNPPNIPLTLESIGHLSRHYFIPWLDYSNTSTKYTPPIDRKNLLFPWLLFNSKMKDYPISQLIPKQTLLEIKKSNSEMYLSCGSDNNIINRIYGIIALNDAQSINQIYSNFSSLIMKEYTEREIRFYEKEKRKLLPDQSDTDAEDLVDLLIAYRKKLENKARVSQFILKYHSVK